VRSIERVKMLAGKHCCVRKCEQCQVVSLGWPTPGLWASPLVLSQEAHKTLPEKAAPLHSYCVLKLVFAAGCVSDGWRITKCTDVLCLVGDHSHKWNFIVLILQHVL
jgi:hypothetical protein